MDVDIHEPDVSPLQISGPKAGKLIRKLFNGVHDDLGYYKARATSLNDIPMVIARTGWSGELSYELYLQNRKKGDELFEIVHEAAKEFNGAVIAPNTIRTIEGGLLSYQSDFGREHNPFTIGLDRLVDLNQDIDFIGKEALKKIKAEGISEKLVGVEIDAGAIQDYKRGIVPGQRTFGKGTVQSLDSISKGQVKITESKYYRVDGSSTQNKGVMPDIELLSTWDIESVGESSYPTALEWDNVRPYRHKKFDFDADKIIKIKNLYSQRLKTSPNLEYLGAVRDRYFINKDKKLLSLNLDIRRSEMEARKEWLLQIENKRREGLGLKTFVNYEDLSANNKIDENINNDIDFKKDYLLIESANIVNDYLNLNKKILVSKVE